MTRSALVSPLVLTLLVGCASADDPPTPVEDTSTDTMTAEETSDTGSFDSDDGSVDGATEGGVDATVDSGVGEAVANLDDALAKSICAKLTFCCSNSEYDSFFLRFQGAPYTLTPGAAAPAAAECVSVVRTQLAALHTKWVSSIGRGRMTFDATKGAACLAAIETAACGTPLSQALHDPACFDIRATTVFRKIAPLGSRCEDLGDTTFYGECDPEQGFCAGPPSKVADRKCVPWRKPGEDCAVIPEWAFCDTRKGSNCDGGSPTKPGTCSGYEKTVPLGSGCSSLTGPLLVCAAGAYCGDGGKCVATKADGAACTADWECVSARARSCYPATSGGAAVCGSSSWCSGAVSDAGADADAPSDAATDVIDSMLVESGVADTFIADTFIADTFVADTFVADTSVADTFVADTNEAAPPATLTVQRTDDPTSGPEKVLTAAVRDRVTVAWDVPGATSVSLAGAGQLVAIITEGTPRWDDLTAAGGGGGRWEKTASLLGTAHVAMLPTGFVANILGDEWKGSFIVGGRGVLSRSSSSGTVSNPALPLPKPTFSTDWTDSTLAPFMDAKLDVNATSKLRYASLGSGSDARAVVEWNDFTVYPENAASKSPAHLTFQAAIYADGRVEYRYKQLSVDATSLRPIADLAHAKGQGATIGLASADGTQIVPLSVRRPSLPSGAPASGLVTYTFHPSARLPAKGTAILAMPAAPGSVALTASNAGSPVATASVTVGAMYTTTTGTGAVRDISTVSGAVTLLPPVLLELPFSLGTFREGWTALTVGKGVVFPWASVGTFLSNDRAIPSNFSPSAIVAAAYPLTSTSWCGGTHHALIEGTAPTRKVIILMKSVYRCGAAAGGTADVQTTLFENGDVELVYDNVTGSGGSLTGESLIAGLENGNGDIGYQAFRNVAGSITSGKRVVFTRHP